MGFRVEAVHFEVKQFRVCCRASCYDSHSFCSYFLLLLVHIFVFYRGGCSATATVAATATFSVIRST